jgi:elongation factor Ts
MAAITAGMVAELREKTGLGMMDCKKALVEADGDMSLAIENLRKKGAATAAKRSGKATKEGKVVSVNDGNFTAIVEINCETEPVSKVDDFVKLIEDVKNAIVAEKPADLDTLLALKIGAQTIKEKTLELIGKIGEKIVVSSYHAENASGNEVNFSYVHSNGKIGSLVKLGADKNVADHGDVKQLGNDVAMQVAAQKPLAIDRNGIASEVIAKETEIIMAQMKNDPKNANKPDAVLEKIAEGKIGRFFKENTLLDQEFIKNDKLSIQQLIDDVSKKVGAALTVVGMKMIELGANSAESDDD